jgi:hypothetical protein
MAEAFGCSKGPLNEVLQSWPVLGLIRGRCNCVTGTASLHARSYFLSLQRTTVLLYESQ